MSPSRPRRLLAGSLAAAVVSAGALVALPADAAVPTSPFLSELHYDNAGTDAGEFVEVQLPPGTSSAGLSVVLYNGGNGAVYDADALPAVTAPADAPAVAVVTYPANGVQNGDPDAVALVRGTEVLEFLSYEGTVTAAGGPAAGRTSTDITVREAGTETAGQSLSRVYDATADALVWRGPAAATSGVVNAGGGTTPTPPPATALCDTPRTAAIGDVQGTGSATPLAGQVVGVRGTVVGDVPGLSGFYLQDAGDGSAATSDGVFVFSPVEVDLGDTVAVQGRPAEFSGQTQIAAGPDVAVCDEGSASDLPAPAALDLPAGDAERERLEGMLVAPADTLTVSEVFDLTSFGELTLSEGGVLLTPTEAAAPGAPARAVAADNLLRSIVLDDAVSARVGVSTRPYLSPSTPVRVGDELHLTAPTVLGFGFGTWRLQPADGTAAGTFTGTNTRPAAPEPVGGDVQVGSFNVLNYFLTFGGLGRGATDQVQFERQAGKIVPAINALGADVVTLLEIEDTDSTGYSPGHADGALADLVARLNADAGYDRWDYVPMPDELLAVDRDVIRNGIIYADDVVQPVGEPVGLVDESVWANAREPIAQTFSKDGDRFTVVANHFKSKSPGAPTGDNVDTGDGQGEWNGDRRRQAASLAAFSEQLQDASGDPDVLLLGDLNAYTREDPIQVLRDAGYTDPGETLDPGRYSYVFDAGSGSLDHALASASLRGKVTDLTHWNINSVESFAYQYTGDPALYAADPYRSSDHDPVLLGVDLVERCDGRRPTITGTEGGDVLHGTNRSDVIMGLGGADRIEGLNGDDVLCGGAGSDVLLGGNGDDTLLGGFGSDLLDGGRGDDRLVGGPGADRLVQGQGRGPARQGGPES
ncbi:hypothetical protein SAMN04488543_2690 [Friedmanniella luteola]|uniref:Endonuclease/exonuclease/phosphatase domain-containing protein n=1 Tax=Friedmanniella luteola TaxID=546871 RepID=A0A1H1WAJ5_9ACTN|nr:ExeM/NucH family extracellular endonuclease [Friedmanniella luteola]SDS94104.1 hypothetical protein SAMN04488543_2690 [Friedmanniella luteola]